MARTPTRSPEEIAIEAAELAHRKHSRAHARYTRLEREAAAAFEESEATKARLDYALMHPDLPEGWQPTVLDSEDEGDEGDGDDPQA